MHGTGSTVIEAAGYGLFQTKMELCSADSNKTDTNHTTKRILKDVHSLIKIS